MLDKLITADQLKMLSDEEKYARPSTYLYNGGGGNADVKYYKILSRTFTGNTWENDRVVFGFTTRHSGSGIMILSYGFGGSFDVEANSDHFDYRIIQSNFGNLSSLRAYYNKNTHTLSILMQASDYSNLKLNFINRMSRDIDQYEFHEPIPLDTIPSDIGDEIPTHECLFDDSLNFASESDVSNLFGGG